jgi:hypothetical protein
MLIPIETQHLKFSTEGFVADAGNHGQPQLRHDRDAVWPRFGIEDSSPFKSVPINPYQACRPTTGHKDLTIVSNYAGGFGKVMQCADMPTGVMVDHLNAVAARVGDEHTTRFRIESSVVEK